MAGTMTSGLGEYYATHGVFMAILYKGSLTILGVRQHSVALTAWESMYITRPSYLTCYQCVCMQQCKTQKFHVECNKAKV